MIIDGVEYVKASEVIQIPDAPHTIVIAPNGWIFIGVQTEANEVGHVCLVGASVVRSWGNGKGIGALADPNTKGDYKLDAIAGPVTVHSPLVTISCQW